jgi:hypothetical protein
MTGYSLGRCRCDYCRDAYARYRAARRAGGKDDPRGQRICSGMAVELTVNDLLEGGFWLVIRCAGLPASVIGHVSTETPS